MGGKGMPTELFWQLPDIVSMTEMPLQAGMAVYSWGWGLKFRIIFPFTLRACDFQLASTAYPWGDSYPGEEYHGPRGLACLLPSDEACCAASTRTRHRTSQEIWSALCHD